MKKHIIFMIATLCSYIMLSQTPEAGLLVNLHDGTTAEINALSNVETGSLVYNTEDERVYVYTGSEWKPLISDGSETILQSGNAAVTITGTGTAADPYIITAIPATLVDNGDDTYTFSNGVDPDVTLTIAQNSIPTPIVSSSDADDGCDEAFQVNETRDVVITGQSFEGSSTVIITGQTVNSITVNSSSQITANVTAVGSPGSYDIEVTNSSGSGTLPNGFEIKPALVTYNFAAADMTLTTQMSYDGSVLRRTGGNGWNRSGYSTVYEIPANSEGYVEFSADQTNRYAMLGLDSNPSQNDSYTTIDYAIYFIPGGSIQVRENTTNRALSPAVNYAVSDLFSINRDCDGVVTYLKNGAVFYTSTVNSTQKLSFDSSFYSNAFQASNISITY